MFPMQMGMGGKGGMGGASTLSLSYDFAGDKSLTGVGPDITLTRASIHGTYFDASGVMQKATTNEARFDHTPLTGAVSFGLLIEKEATNSLLRSAQLDLLWAAIGTATVVTDQADGLDGNTAADEVTFGTANWHRHRQDTAVNTTAGVEYTFSVWGLVASGTEDFRLSIQDQTPGGSNEQDSGDFGLTTTPARYQFVATYDAVNTARWAALKNDASGTAAARLFWGAQLEVGDFATSHIMTTNLPLTRAADVTSATVTTYLGSENTLYVSARTGKAQDAVLLQIDDGTENERYRIARVSGDIHVITTDGGGDVADLDLGAVADNTAFKVAARFATDDFAASLDGAAVVTDTGGVLPTITTLRVGMGTSGDEWNSTIAAVKLWADAKDDTFLMAQST